MNEKMKMMLKEMNLEGWVRNWPEYSKLAKEKNLTHLRWLEHMIEQEHLEKKERSRKRRHKLAGYDEYRAMETFPFNRQPKLSRKKILDLYSSFDYLEKRQNILWIGPTGCGKSGLATSFLVHALDNGYNGKFILFSDLMELFFQAAADRSEDRQLRRFVKYDLLLIDEIGYVQADPQQVGHFFTLLHKRHKKKTTLITTNLGFDEWTGFLKNEQLTAALIDRLTENAHVINMKGCKSLRKRLAPKSDE